MRKGCRIFEDEQDDDTHRLGLLLTDAGKDGKSPVYLTVKVTARGDGLPIGEKKGLLARELVQLLKKLLPDDSYFETYEKPLTFEDCPPPVAGPPLIEGWRKK